MPHQKIRNAFPTDADRCFEIETTAYDGDEAATFQKISKRIVEYSQGFLVLEVESSIAGFINSGCTYDVEMSDEDFKDLIGHDPEAPKVVILSLVVDPAYQGRGLSKALMIEFVRRMTDVGKTSIHLMCKEQHVPLYEKLGYLYACPSASNHGGVRWHEMAMEITQN